MSRLIKIAAIAVLMLGSSPVAVAETAAAPAATALDATSAATTDTISVGDARAVPDIVLLGMIVAGMIIVGMAARRRQPGQRVTY